MESWHHFRHVFKIPSSQLKFKNVFGQFSKFYNRITKFELGRGTGSMSRSRSRFDNLAFQRDNYSCRGCPTGVPALTPDSPEMEGKSQYKSGSLQRYCDLLDSGVEGNPEMLLDIIKDLRCVFDKIFGTSKNLEGRNRNLQDLIASLKSEIGKLEECKAALQRELSRIQGELIMAQKAYEDEVDQRIGLENLITQLRLKVSRLEGEAEVDAKEKTELAICVQQLEGRLKEAYAVIEALKKENHDLSAALREANDWKSRQNENMSMSNGRCGQLEEALARCCKTNEELQREVTELRNELDTLKRCLEKLKSEIKRLCEELDRERKNWALESGAYQKTIGELKNALDAQTLKNLEMAEKLRKGTECHRQEIDCLSKKVDKYCALYHQEKTAREQLEVRLRECEERARRNSSSSQGPTQGAGSYSCSSIADCHHLSDGC